MSSTHYPEYPETTSRLPIDVCNERTVEGDAGPTAKHFKGYGAWRAPPAIEIYLSRVSLLALRMEEFACTMPGLFLRFCVDV